MIKPRFSSLAVPALASWLALMHASSAMGQTSTWTNAANGTFDVASNWTGGVPGASSTAVFNATPAAYTVSFTNSPTNSILRVDNGNVTFDLNSNTYSLTGAASVQVGSVAGLTGRLTVIDGTLQSTSANIGVNNGTGFMTVGTAGIWNAPIGLNVGTTGDGSLTIQGAGTVSTANVTFGSSAGITGTLTMTGSGSLLTHTGNLLIGSLGTGTVSVNSGADINTTGIGFIGNSASGQGTVLVTGSGSTWTLGSGLNVGNSGTGLLTVTSGGGVSASNSINIAALANSTGTVNVGGGTGTSSLTTTQNVVVGGNTGAQGGTGQLNLSTNGSVSANSLILWQSGNVQMNGGSLILNSFTPNGGSFQFNSGTVQFNNNITLDHIALSTLFGPSRTLVAGQTLTAPATMTFSSPLTINGGTLSVNALGVGAPLQLQTGTLSVNASNLPIGTGTPLGNAVAVGSGMNLLVPNNAMTIGADGLLRIAGGLLNVNSLTNTGIVELASSTGLMTGGTFTNQGTLRGTGRVFNALTNTTSGQIQLATGDRMTLGGGTNTNQGLISLIGGELQVNNAMTNAASTGLISARDAILRFNGGLANNGSMVFSNGTVDVFGDITSQRFVSASDRSRITVSGGGIANFYDDVLVAAGQTDVQVSSAGGLVSAAVFFGSYNGGTTGGGAAFIEGDHRPGHSPGLVAFEGSVFYGSASRLIVEIGGSQRGIDYDAINVLGQISLAGELEIQMLNGFQPAFGSKLLLVDNDGVDAIQGQFQGLAEGAFFGSGGLLWTITYQGGTGNDIILTAVPEPTTWLLIGTSVLAAWVYRRRRNAPALPME